MGDTIDPCVVETACGAETPPSSDTTLNGSGTFLSGGLLFSERLKILEENCSCLALGARFVQGAHHFTTVRARRRSLPPPYVSPRAPFLC